MSYTGPTFFVFWYKPCEEKTYEAGKKPDRIPHQVEINGLINGALKQNVHIHVSSCGSIPQNVNYYGDADKNDETTKIIVAFAKLVASGVVELREGSSPL